MSRHRILYWVMMACLLFSGCKESFEVEYEVQDVSPILVVEGYINVGGTQSRYDLAYALPLNKEGEAYTDNIPLTNALITIESERGEKYNASGSGSGIYMIQHPMLDQDQQYRLRIQTGQTEYLSAFVPVKVSPEIGELEWERTADGLQIYLNTADPFNNTRYYRWEYEDTWVYFSQYRSWYILDGVQVRQREEHELIHKCYISGRSSDIYLASSEELATDAIYRFPLVFVPNLSDKFSERYSVLIRQMPLTAEAYAYWKQLRESSQNLGDLFGPMPAELKGNITCVSNPDFHAIGMVEAIQVAEKRIYINRLDMSDYWPVDNNFFNCILESGTVASAISFVLANPNFLIVEEQAAMEDRPDLITGYTYSARRCVDCALRGGTYLPPAFWQSR